MVENKILNIGDNRRQQLLKRKTPPLMLKWDVGGGEEAIKVKDTCKKRRKERRTGIEK